MTQAPIEVAQLPEATNYLNFPHTGPPVGAYIGGGDRWFTVVSNEPRGDGKRRIGLARGIYMIDGAPTDSRGWPAEIAYAKMQADWAALKTPGVGRFLTDAGGNDA